MIAHLHILYSSVFAAVLKTAVVVAQVLCGLCRQPFSHSSAQGQEGGPLEEEERL